MRGDLDIQIASESSKAHWLTPRDEPSKLAALLGPPTRRAGGGAGLRGLPRGGAGECALELRRRAQRPAGRGPTGKCGVEFQQPNLDIHSFAALVFFLRHVVHG